jgi:hypothetical protein
MVFDQCYSVVILYGLGTVLDSGYIVWFLKSVVQFLYCVVFGTVFVCGYNVWFGNSLVSGYNKWLGTSIVQWLCFEVFEQCCSKFIMCGF